MAEADDIEFITRRLDIINDEPNWTPTEDYYIYIDVLDGGSTTVYTKLNSFMIRKDSFDPRRIHNFPTDLLEQGEKDTLKRRKQLAGVDNTYYRLWKVRRGFSLPEFRGLVEGLPGRVKVRLVRFIDNDHDINIYNSISSN